MLFYFLVLWIPASSVSYTQLSHTDNRWLMSANYKLYAYIMYLYWLNVYPRLEKRKFWKLCLNSMTASVVS